MTAIDRGTLERLFSSQRKEILKRLVRRLLNPKDAEVSLQEVFRRYVEYMESAQGLPAEVPAAARKRYSDQLLDTILSTVVEQRNRGTLSETAPNRDKQSQAADGLKSSLSSVAQGNSLTRAEARSAFEIMMSGQATEAQIGAFLMALRVRGETVEEITAGAEIMREKALKIDAPANAIDTCGTGGDASGSYNVSTAVSLVVAACGVPVAKHGNRALSSRAGAADVLKSLGVNIEAEPAQVAACIREASVGFLFAPRHHSAMRHVGPARAQLGTRTIFNLLGPLSNPAGTKRQIVGVFADKWVRPMAEVLKQLGSEAAWVVHGLDGLDEITTTGPTHVAELKDGEIQEFEVTPEEAGLARAIPDQLKGGDAETNALALSALVDGHEGPYRDIVLLNSAAALIVAGKADNLTMGLKMAAAAVDAGGARKALDTLVRVSNLDIEPAEASARA